MLQFMESQRVGCDLATEQLLTRPKNPKSLLVLPSLLSNTRQKQFHKNLILCFPITVDGCVTSPELDLYFYQPLKE